MSAEGTQQSLQTVLSQEATCSERLLACLQAERKALSRRDMEALQKTIQEKLQHTQQLEQLDQQRESLVTELGYSADSAGMKQCFASLPNRDSATQLWQQVLNNIEACRNSNLTNGGVLEASRQHVEQVLCILRGQSATPALYSPNGDTSTNLGQRELGKV
jgi:flagella synthesis protein FlgN